MTKIWEGANAKNADLDAKVGLCYNSVFFCAALFDKSYVACSCAGGAKFAGTFFTKC